MGGSLELGGRRVAKSWVPLGLALTVFLAGAFAMLTPTPAVAAGGANIASAPIIPFGQQVFGTTVTGEYDCGPGEFWNLSLQPGDEAVIDWETAQEKYAHELVIYPPGTTDFSINNAESLNRYYLGENNKQEAIFTTGSGGVFPIVFAADGCDEDHDGGPYDFTVVARHAILVNLKQVANLSTTSTLSASANLATGGPIPDGLAFTLTATWSRGGTASYTASSSGGNISFPLALPESAVGQSVSFVVTRPADAQFQAVKSGEVKATVAVPPAPVHRESPCEKALRRVRSKQNQYRRLRAHAHYARGAARRRLLNRARRAHFGLRVAQHQEEQLCAA